jgi:hypothetical protein
LFRQKLLDGLPIILCEPIVCDHFNNQHEESVPVIVVREDDRDRIFTWRARSVNLRSAAAPDLLL